MARTVLQRKLRKGEVIGDRYQISRKLGEGGCGTVYRATDTKGGADVAVKVLENHEDLPRFRREARVMQRTTSEHVVKALAVGVHEKTYAYLVMEFMDGGSVKDLLDKKGKFSPADAGWILIQAVRGLKAAGSVHRDLKPENLLVSKGSKGRSVTLMAGDIDSGATVKVADFGLAKSKVGESASLTQTGQVMGTPLYMSPEQCRNTKRVSARSDIYSLGVMLFELVTGRPPFDANNVYDIMAMHCNDEPKTGRLPAKVRVIVDRCMQKSVRLRYPSLAALERDLEVLVGIRNGNLDGSGGSHKWLIAIVLLAVVAALAVAGWWFRDLLPFIGGTDS